MNHLGDPFLIDSSFFLNPGGRLNWRDHSDLIEYRAECFTGFDPIERSHCVPPHRPGGDFSVRSPGRDNAHNQRNYRQHERNRHVEQHCIRQFSRCIFLQAMKCRGRGDRQPMFAARRQAKYGQTVTWIQY
jgi:hypothetical protein